MRANTRALAQISRLSDDAGLHSLKERYFRQKVLTFFLPPLSSWRPFEFFRHSSTRTPEFAPGQASSGEAAHPEETHALSSVAECCNPAEAGQQGCASPNTEKEENLAEAMERSTADAIARENSDLADAIVRSKADFSHGVVILRLTRHAKASEVASALCYSAELAECRGSVSEAGCELQPEWAGGAWLLLPLTREVFEEAGLRTSAIHILARSRDEARVREALYHVPFKKRPKLKVQQRGDILLQDASERAEAGSEADIVEERTFVHFSAFEEDGQSAWHSAPF